MWSDGLHEFIGSRLFLLTLTVGVYLGARRLYQLLRFPLLNPLLVSMAVIIAFLKLADIDYKTYYEANGIINFLLGLSVVALGYLLYDNIEHIRGRERSILVSLFAGSIVGVVSVVGIALLFGVGRDIVASLQPKSVTTPIAVMLSENSGGMPALTVVGVIFAGLLGSMIGPWMLRLMKVDDPVARGLALGAASHAVGTAKAMELGAVEGAVGGAAIGIMGVMTAVVIPLVERLIY